MKPFDVTSIPLSAFKRYPNPLDFLQYSLSISESELEGYLRQQVTEGIPYVFLDTPLLYEVVRDWLAKRVGTHAKDITLIGSGRTGFSMAPAPQFGSPYKETSDLDFTIVSERLFIQMSEAFENWQTEYQEGVAIPKSLREENFWLDNLANIPNNLRRGFIDTYKIPNLYHTPQKINNNLWALGQKLALTKKTDPPKISARIYRDWHAFSKQFLINFHHAIRNVDENHRLLLTFTLDQAAHIR